MSDCAHEESLHGRCTACGMTWTEQAAQRGESPGYRTSARRVAEGLRAWARGYLPAMAAVELIIGTDMATQIVPLIEWRDSDRLAMSWPDDWEDQFAYLSGGEMAALRLAHATHVGIIAEEYSRLDRHRKLAFRKALEEFDK